MTNLCTLFVKFIALLPSLMTTFCICVIIGWSVNDHTFSGCHIRLDAFLLAELSILAIFLYILFSLSFDSFQSTILFGYPEAYRFLEKFMIASLMVFGTAPAIGLILMILIQVSYSDSFRKIELVFYWIVNSLLFLAMVLLDIAGILVFCSEHFKIQRMKREIRRKAESSGVELIKLNLAPKLKTEERFRGLIHLYQKYNYGAHSGYQELEYPYLFEIFVRPYSSIDKSRGGRKKCKTCDNEFKLNDSIFVVKESDHIFHWTCRRSTLASTSGRCACCTVNTFKQTLFDALQKYV